MKIGTITLCLFLVFLSCKDVQDKATESVTNTVIEKTLENTGIATENIARANKNATQVSISLEDKKLFDKDVFNGIVNATERMIVFSLDNENDDAKINITALKRKIAPTAIIRRFNIVLEDLTLLVLKLFHSLYFFVKI